MLVLCHHRPNLGLSAHPVPCPRMLLILCAPPLLAPVPGEAALRLPVVT